MAFGAASHDGADVHMTNIDTGISENRADFSNHSRSVQIAAEQDEAMGSEIGGILVHTNDSLLPPGDGSGEPLHLRDGAATISLDPYLYKIGVLRSSGGAALKDLQSPISGQYRRIDEIYVHLGD